MMRGKWSLIALGVVAVVLAAAALFAGSLILPGKPNSVPGLTFAGFIPLPKGPKAGMLSVLDYMTIYNRDLYVTSESDGSVYRVGLDLEGDPGAAKVEVLSGDPAAHGVVIDPVSQIGFVTKSEVNRVDVFNPLNLKMLGGIPVAGDADGLFYEPNARLIYAVHGDPHTATVIDPATRSRVGMIDLGGKPEFAVFDARTGRIYQNLADINAIAVVDVAARRVVETWPLTGCRAPTSIALDPGDRRLFVVCKDNSQLVVVDMNSHKVVANLPVGGGPDSVAYDPDLHRLYSAGVAGVLTVMEQDGPNTYHRLGAVKTHYGAHTLAVDPVSHRVYVAYASVLVGPRLAVFDAADGAKR